MRGAWREVLMGLYSLRERLASWAIAYQSLSKQDDVWVRLTVGRPRIGGMEGAYPELCLC